MIYLKNEKDIQYILKCICQIPFFSCFIESTRDRASEIEKKINIVSILRFIQVLPV